ncbi:ORF6N domain-containing protein [Laribacter hongkongensis]|uniref:ORF6N domain-containing protein n=2 Tax=Laribacter hongkongensis TaxID=168471 RepID=A0ABD4SUP5_9NEIS|nr:ORF6N domain-containing protein [Laribacter hongkongensis]MCG9027204.1 ORF6N domain-containing protein [Laribacter hongkongensis]MCG9101795.1 ORF6N domain-containing protein [Laribacter hongkongensis]MCG9114086.1 ORF6N domain-containing protein [Laribacter hongkongensis]
MMTSVTKTTAAPLLKDAPIIDFGSIKLPQVTYKGQPVLTARAIAVALGCASPQYINTNFRRNLDKFSEGMDYFRLTPTEAQGLGFPYPRGVKVSKHQIDGLTLFTYSGRGLVLFTRRGLAKLSKSIGTPEAWAMMDTFIDAYFTLEGIATGPLSTREEAAQKAHEVVAKGASLLPGIDLQLAGKNAPKAFESPLHEAESLLKAALVSMGRAIGSNNMLERQKEELEGHLRAASMGHAGTAAL